MRLRLRLAEVLQRGRERAVVARRGGDEVLELGLGLLVLGALEELARRARPSRRGSSAGRFTSCWWKPFAPAKSLPSSASVISVRSVCSLSAGTCLQGERLLVALARRRHRRDPGGGARARGARPDRCPSARWPSRRCWIASSGRPSIFAMPASDDGRRVLLGPGLRGARLEVLHERGEVAVLVAIELREALEREGRAGLGEDDLRVAIDERRSATVPRRGWPPCRACRGSPAERGDRRVASVVLRAASVGLRAGRAVRPAASSGHAGRSPGALAGGASKTADEPERGQRQKPSKTHDYKLRPERAVPH